VRFRSKAEISFASWLIKEGINYEYEKHKFKYIPDPRVYMPDFYLTKYKFFIEVKGLFDKADRKKHLLIKKQHKKLDVRILFLNANNKIYKGSKTTYGAWCDKHDIMWCEKKVPKEWLK